ncbi:MAG: polysulfide reductase NrfD [Deltaproteobacteria bacterium]|nr:polysulfide reductase NrfD [Deltaproteobacteria bacterium]
MDSVAARALEREHPDLVPLIRTGWGYYGTVAGLLALIVLGGYTYIRQWIEGLAITGMNVPVSWGLYIVNFVFFVGLSAGGILVAALAHAVGVERLKPIGRVAELGAISCLILAAIFVFLDLGRPDRWYHLLLYARFQSPLIWDFAIVAIYLAIAMALGYFSTRADLVRCMEALPRRRALYRLLCLGYVDVSPPALARDRRTLKVLAVASIPAAVLLHSITAWLFGLLKAHPGWHSALLAPLFIVSASVSGLAMVIVALVVARRFLRVAVQDDVIHDLGRVLVLAIPVLGYFLFAEMLTVLYAGEPAPLSVFQEMMFGRYAPIFWFNLMLGLLLPILLLWRPPRWAVATVGIPAVLLLSLVPYQLQLAIPTPLGRFFPYVLGIFLPAWMEYTLIGLLTIVLPLLLLAGPRLRTVDRIGCAAGLVVLGVLAERANIVLPPLLKTLLPYPAGSYTPTTPELLIVLGAYSIGGLAFVLLAKLFPLVEAHPAAEG